MNLKSLTFSSEQVLGSDTAILVGQKPLYEYKDNKRTDNQIGMTYTVLAFQNGSMESVNVKVEGAKELNISEEELIEANKSLNFIFVRFTDFIGKPYNASSGLAVSCCAKSITIIERDDIDTIEL